MSCFYKKESEGSIEIPIIENIHQKILEAVLVPNAFDMSTWHTCDTTHCRAGWVVHLAGAAGKELELKTSTSFAAIAIYHKSSDIKVNPCSFYWNNERAMEDIKSLAAIETTT